MSYVKKKGYRAELKIRKMFEENGWKVVRAAGSLGVADLICVKKKRCILLQIKSTKKNKFYYYEYEKDKIEGFPFYLIVDFGYGKIRIVRPKKVITPEDGKDLKEFLSKI